MRLPAGERWAGVRRRRLELADRVDALALAELDAPSRCVGWRVRDVLGHLVCLAESTQASVARDLATGGFSVDSMLARHGRRLGALSRDDLVARLRAGADGHFHIVGTPRAVVLGEVLVHGRDALDPLGHALVDDPEDALAVLDTYRRVGRLAFHARSTRGVRLRATDVEWSSGTGREVRGRAVDLLPLLANRREVLAALDGPRVALLD